MTTFKNKYKKDSTKRKLQNKNSIGLNNTNSTSNKIICLRHSSTGEKTEQLKDQEETVWGILKLKDINT